MKMMKAEKEMFILVEEIKLHMMTFYPADKLPLQIHVFQVP